MKHRFAAALSALALLAANPAIADTLVDNVEGITVGEDGAIERFDALVIGDDGRIDQVLKKGDTRPRTDYREDGKGRIMLPGLIDAHVHVMGLGIGALTLDLSDTRSLDEALEKIRRFA